MILSMGVMGSELGLCVGGDKVVQGWGRGQGIKFMERF